MKFIDLTDQTFRQTIVDREKDVYLGQLSSVMLEDDRTIVAVYPKGHGRGSLVMKKSLDGGLTWGERMSLPESFVTSLEVPTLYRMTDADGRRRLILFSGFYPIRTSVSEDDGETWSELTPIGDVSGICVMGDILPGPCPGEYAALYHDDQVSHTEQGGTRYEIWRYSDGSRTKYMRMLFRQQEDGTFGESEQTVWADGDPSVPDRDGTKIYEAYFSNMDHGGQLEIRGIITRDGGLTWEEPRTVMRHDTAYLCEPGIIRLKDGTVAVLMRDNSRKHNSFIMFSHDNGNTFTGLRELPDVLTGDRHVCRRLRDGRIAVTFRDRHAQSETFGDWVLWVGTDEDLLEGRDGEYKFRLKDNLGVDCGYAGLHILPDDTIVGITYGRWEKNEKQYILAVRLRLDEF